ncbi:hypothetical protein G9A89_011703 [Geosiphon pyriformis]|nr:hypothetical protein G9A89_011703 [Geosiphon pyriformis]
MSSKDIFRDCFITFSGTFEEGSHSKLSAIVEEYGGTHTGSVGKTTTHLVVTIADFQRPSAKAQAAQKKGEAVFIVTWAWVKDSIAKNTRLVEANYAPNAITREPTAEVQGEECENENDLNQKVSAQEIVDSVKEVAAEDEETPPRKRRRTTRTTTIATASSATKTMTTTTTTLSKKVMATNDQDDNITATTKLTKKRKATILKKTSIDTTSTVTEDVLKKEEKKMVTIIKKGKAPVDPLSRLKDTTHVYSEDQVVWDCVLNQTDLRSNSNKFYVIQLLQSDSGSAYYVFTRWGRVGYDGQQTTVGPLNSLDRAKSEFGSKFRSKTKNSWELVCSETSNFVAYSGKYTLIERDYGDDSLAEHKSELSVPPKEVKGKELEEEELKPISNLHPKVQDIISMIFDVGSWEDTMVALNYDAAKLPLGKLSKSTVNKGYQVLQKIANVLNCTEMGDLTGLTNEFYTVIPHSFGFKKPPLINNNEILKGKLEMVETLGEIEIAASLLKQANSSPKNLIDAHYDSLMLDSLEPLDHDSQEFKLITKYVANTQGVTHNYYTLEVMEVFQLERRGERQRYEPFSRFHNRMLLWHGSRKTNYPGILSQGLRIAPPGVPSTGYMFDKGVYFADCVSKSANYCFTDSTNNIGLMLLCEVACGDMLELTDSDYNASQRVKQAGKHSTKGVGIIEPDPKGTVTLENGTLVPCGRGKTLKKTNSLQYNEYIVYDTSQIVQKYLIKMKFEYKY